MGLSLQTNIPIIQRASSTNNLIAIRSNVPVACSAIIPVENVSTQNNSGPLNFRSCSLLKGERIDLPFEKRKEMARHVRIRKYR